MASQLDEQQQELDTMIAYWSQFAKVGDPTGQACGFGANDPTIDEFIRLSRLATPEFEFATDHKCDFWAASLAHVRAASTDK
jgi:carboxylesterase type B